MSSQRNIERLCGVLLIAMLAATIASGATDIYVDPRRDKIGNSLREISGNEAQYLASLSLGILIGLITPVLSAAIYLVFSRQERPLALLGAFALMAAGITSLVAGVFRFAIFSLSEDLSATSGPDSDVLTAIARALAYGNDRVAFYATLTLLGLGVAAVGAVIVRRRILPRWLGWLGVIGGLLMILDWLDLLGVPVFGIIGFLCTLVFMLTAGGWLLFRGTRPPTPDSNRAA